MVSSVVDDPHYIQGAGDDEEGWAMGLSPKLFWENHSYILEHDSRDIIENRIHQANLLALFAFRLKSAKEPSDCDP